MNFQSVSSDLTECDREPIHQIGEVQAFGALIAVDADWKITHFSTNWAGLSGSDEVMRQGDPLRNHFTAAAINALEAALAKLVEDDHGRAAFRA